MTCKLSAIVAVCDDWGIGCEGDMVVSNRADMRHFVACTKDCPVIMGRKTLLSFPGGRPLKNRRNIVLTRDEDFAVEGVDVVHSIDEALAAQRKTFIHGGTFTNEKGETVKSANGKNLRHPFSGTVIALRNGCSDAIGHIIANHAHEGDGTLRSPEGVLVNKADFINFESVKSFLGMK